MALLLLNLTLTLSFTLRFTLTCGTRARDPASNKHRKALNLILNEKRGLFIKDPGVEPRQQDFWLHPGMRLLCMKTACGMTNGSFWNVQDVSETAVTLTPLNGGESRELPLEKVPRMLLLSFACTYHCVQGATLQGRIRCWDAQHPRFTTTHLYVGCSRATAAEFVEVM